MADFKEQDVFTGAIQTQGFSAQQAPDTSRFLRENMAQMDQNYARIESSQQAELDKKLKKQQEILSTLGQFSETAMNFAQTMGKAFIDQQIIEGQNKARSLGKTFNYGIDPKQEADLEELTEQSKKEHAAAGIAAVEMRKSGAPLEAVNYIKSLPVYQRIGATRSYLKNKGGVYKDYLKAFMQRDDIKLPHPNGGTFSPQQIDDDPVLMQVALAAASRQFMAEEVGIGSDFNPTAVAAKGLYESMDETEDTFMEVVRRNKTINDSSEMVAEATEIYRANGDLNAYLSALTGSIDEEGNVRGRGDALDYVFERMVDAYYAGDTSVKEQLENTPVLDENGNPTGQTWAQRFKNRIEGEKGVNARFDAIDRRKRQERRDQESANLEDRRLNFEAAARQRADEGRPFTDDEIDVMLQDAMADTGKDESFFPWFTKYQTVEKRDAKLEADELDDLRQRRGYLIESDLRNMSSATYKAYISIVQEDESIAQLPKSYTTDANKLITALTNEKFKDQIGVAEKSSDWEDMARRARDKYPQYVQEEIRAGNPPALAQKNALQRLKDNFAAGTYTKDPNITEDLQYLKTLRTARLTMGMNPKIDEYVFNGTDNELKRLVDYNEGRGEIPKFYYDMAQGQKNLTAWDIAAAQYRAAGYGELGVHGKKAQFDRLDPALQSVLTYKPTPNKVKRAQATSFKPEANVQGASGYRGSSEVVDTGLKDYKGRPIRLAPQAADSFKAMVAAMEAEGIPFNPNDMANVYRDEAEYLRLKREGYNPSSGGFHNFGLAFDGHGRLNEFARRRGAEFGFYPHDYEGTHGGHFEFRGVKQ